MCSMQLKSVNGSPPKFLPVEKPFATLISFNFTGFFRFRYTPSKKSSYVKGFFFVVKTATLLWGEPFTD